MTKDLLYLDEKYADCPLAMAGWKHARDLRQKITGAFPTKKSMPFLLLS